MDRLATSTTSTESGVNNFSCLIHLAGFSIFSKRVLNCFESTRINIDHLTVGMRSFRAVVLNDEHKFDLEFLLFD